MTLLSPSELLAFDGFLQGFTGAGSSSVPRPSGVHGGGAGSSSLKQHAGSVSVSANGANQLNNGNADRDSALFGPGQHHQEAPLGAHRSHLSEREQAPHGLVSVSFPAAQYRPRQSYRPHSSSSAASNASSNFSPVPPFRAAHAHQEQERRMKAQASELAGWMNWHERLRAGLPSPPKEAPPPLPASGASRSSNGPPNGSTHVNGNGRVPQPHLSPLDTSLPHSLPLPLDPALEQLTFSRTVFPPPQPPAASPSNDIGSSRATKKIGGKGRGRGLDAVASHAALESAEPPAKKQKTAVKPGAKRAGMRTKEQVEQSSFAPGTPSQQIPPETVDDLPPHMQPMPSRVSQPTTNGHSDAGAGAVDTFNQPQASTSATPAPGVNGFDRQFPANDESADLAPSAKKRSTTSNGTAASGASKPTVNAAAGRRRSSASTSASVTKRPSPPINQAPASGTQSSGQAGALGGASASAVSRDMASVPSTIPPIPPEAPDFAHGGSSVSDAPPAPSPAASQPPLPKVVLTEEQKRANHIASEQKRRTAIRSAYDELCGVVPSLRAAVQEYEERLTRVHGAQAAAAAASRRGSAGRSDGTQGTGGTEIETVAGVLTGGIDVGGEKVDGRAGPKSEAVVLGKTVEYLRDLLEEREELLARYTELVGRTAYDAGNDLQAVWNAKWSKKLT